MPIKTKETVMMSDEVGNQITLTKVKPIGWVADVETTYGDIDSGAKTFTRKRDAMRWGRQKLATLYAEQGWKD